MMTARRRLSVIRRHLDDRPPLPALNTPFSTERNAHSAEAEDDDEEYDGNNKSEMSEEEVRRRVLLPDVARRFSTASSSSSSSSTTSPPTTSEATPSSTLETEAEIEPETDTTTEEETEIQSDINMAAADRPSLLIPGPVEFDDAVLHSMSHHAESHVSPAFVNTFGATLTLVRKLLQSSDPAAQPFVISGSGTLGWELVAANLVERGDDALVLHTGYFGDSFASCLESYGVRATQLKAPVGDRPSLPEIEQALTTKHYRIITITHVDTSTGVLSDIKAVAQLVRRVSPDTLVVVDAVCSVGCEDLAFDAWGIDVVLTASQKAIGCPPGLSIAMCSARALERFRARATPPSSYYASLANWLPIMQNYEARKPSYFATPPTQLVHALHAALTQLLHPNNTTTTTTTATAKTNDADNNNPLTARFAAHAAASARVKSAVADLGLTQLAARPEDQAHAMTTIRLPPGVTPPDVLPGLLKRGVIFAGGLHRDIASTYIRFGHMGASVMDPARGDIDRAIAALREVFAEVGSESRAM